MYDRLAEICEQADRRSIRAMLITGAGDGLRRRNRHLAVPRLTRKDALDYEARIDRC